MRRGTALLAGAYLVGWIPFTFAVELLGAWSSIPMRGTAAIVELAVHALVSLLCATAGWILWSRTPPPFLPPAAAIVAAAAMQIQSLFLTVLPHDYAPGDRVPLSIASAAAAALWLALVHVAARAGVSTR